MAEQPSILLIEDEPRLRRNLQLLLQSEGYLITTASNGVEGIQKVAEEPYDLVITEHVSTESAIAALRRGAYDYLSKPFDFNLMKIAVERALEKGRLQKTL